MLVESLGEIDNSRKNALIKKKATCALLDTWSSVKNEISKIKII